MIIEQGALAPCFVTIGRKGEGAMPIIETTTTFYLGNQFDLAAGQPTGEMVYYVSRDLTTHAVVMESVHVALSVSSIACSKR